MSHFASPELQDCELASTSPAYLARSTEPEQWSPASYLSPDRSYAEQWPFYTEEHSFGYQRPSESEHDGLASQVHHQPYQQMLHEHPLQVEQASETVSNHIFAFPAFHSEDDTNFVPSTISPIWARVDSFQQGYPCVAYPEAHDHEHYVSNAGTDGFLTRQPQHFQRFDSGADVQYLSEAHNCEEGSQYDSMISEVASSCSPSMSLLSTKGGATLSSRCSAEVKESGPDILNAHKTLPSDPPSSDVQSPNPNLQAQKQQQQQHGTDDGYSPIWVRGHGKTREGWCGLCRPGRWLNLKNSAYWYDKRFNHGIDRDGSLLRRPRETRRRPGQQDFEGLCADCDAWVLLGNGVKWFRHVYYRVCAHYIPPLTKTIRYFPTHTARRF